LFDWYIDVVMFFIIWDVAVIVNIYINI